MSGKTMYPVQGMRKFVCDRLTAAAQEILGAFETRVEDYEAEIARQRRLLDQVFNPDIKLQRTEILVSEQICQNPHRNSESESRPVPDITRIKDELEEVCISREQQLHPQQQEVSASKLTSVCDPSVSSHQPQPSDRDQQSSATKDLPSNTSNKDGKSESNKETSRASVAHSEQPGSSCETETQQHITDDATTAGCDPCPDGNKKSSLVSQEENTCVPKESDEVNTENTALHQSSDGSPASISELKLWKESDVVTQTEKVSDTGEEKEQNTMQTRDDDTTTSVKGNEKIKNQRLSFSGSAEPVQGDNGKDGRPVSAMGTAPESRPASTEMEPTSNWENEEWICRSLEQTQNEKSSDLDVLSSLWTELTCNEKSRCQDPTLTEQEQQTPHERKDDTNASVTAEQTPSKESNEAKTELKSKKKHKDKKMFDRNSDPMMKNKSEDGKTSSSGKKMHKNHGHYRKSEASQPNNEGPGETRSRKLEEDKDGLSLKSTQDEQNGDGVAASTGDNKTTQKDFGEKSAKSKETRPLGRCSDGKKASRSSKPKHKLTDRSSDANKSKETPSKRKPSEKETASLKRLNEGQSSDSAQKRRKDGNSATRNEEKEQNDKNNATFKKNVEQSPDGGHEGSSGEEKEDPFKCDTCGKVMSNFKNYKFHMKSHTVEKTFKCGTCGKMFRESWDLNKHLVIHSVEKPYKCDICGNGFNRRYNLDLHVRVHTGEKPYVCSTCGKSFSSCVNMKKHMRIHTGEKPYTCKDCGKEFADSSAFKNHLRVHTGEKPFKCTFCKRKFATRTTLKRHTRTHTGEKPYKCTVCDKMFGHRTDLKGHMRMHTGEKPYKCGTCGDRFSNWSKLNKHKRVHVSEPQSSTE